MSFDLNELATCTRCDLSLTRRQVVIGSGPRDPVLMVVGEAPGKTEDEGGEPFIGRSGRLLFRLIEEELGLSRERCFVTNVVKCRPPNNRTPVAHEIETCRPWFLAQLVDVRPRVVLALGNTAARSIFGYVEGIGQTHGRITQLESGPGMATYHPAAALRSGSTVLDVMRSDLARLADLVAP
ncbi:MAG: uracil-DNA glycosylase [Acidimicrobiales bacterium]|jgi:DNA polymerase